MPTPKEACRELLTAQYGRLTETFAGLQIFQSTIRTSTRRAVEQSLLRAERLEAQGRVDSSYSLHNMHFRSLSDGAHVFYAKSLRTSEVIRRDMHLHENKQFRWIVVEGYEAYEDFIEVCYACAQHLGENLWKKEEMRRAEREAGKSPATLEALFKIATDGRTTGDARTKINRFRAHFSEFRAAEDQKAIGPGPHFLLPLAELLRHVIVHKAGNIASRAEFEALVLSRAGLQNNGRPDPMYVNEIAFYLSEYEGQCIVRLSDAPTSEIPFGIVSRVDAILQVLLAYAHFIYAELLLPRTHP
jgi:hypothetical protein